MAIKPEVIQRRLRMMRELLVLLDEFGSPTAEELKGDLRTRLLVEKILSQVVDLAVEINTHVIVERGSLPPKSYGDSFPEAGRVGLIREQLAKSLVPSAGMRNVIIHDYVNVDYERVARAVPLARRDYGQYVSEVASYLIELAG